MSLQEIQNRMKEELRKLPKIDSNGVPIPTAPPTQQATAPTGDELLASLMDSVSFQEAAARLDPEDTPAMQKLIKDHLDPRPKMQANPLQGGGKSVAAPKPRQSLLESLTEQFGPGADFDYSAHTPIN